MNKEKQIEKDELFGILSNTINGANFDDLSEAVYKVSDVAGYRKQEWISVEDRLPTHKDGKVLIYTAYGISIAERTVNNRWRGDCAIPKLITHWMPLPEVPKMKGGAE